MASQRCTCNVVCAQAPQSPHLLALAVGRWLAVLRHHIVDHLGDDFAVLVLDATQAQLLQVARCGPDDLGVGQGLDCRACHGQSLQDEEL